MYINGFTITNIGSLEQVEITTPFDTDEKRQVTLVTGANGSGKSLLLRAAAYALTWANCRIKNDKMNGKIYPLEDIRAHSDHSSVTMYARDAHVDGAFRWSITRQRQGDTFADKADITELVSMTRHYNDAQKKEADAALPLITYYPTNRQVGLISLAAKNSKVNAATLLDSKVPQSTDLGSFFNWFRDQEDQENEQLGLQIKQHALKKMLTSANPDLEPLFQHVRSLQQQTGHPAMMATRRVLSQMFPDIENWRIERHPQLRMLCDRQGESMDIKHLPYHDLQWLAFVGDIMRQLAIFNTLSLRPDEENAVILIDDIDLHLDANHQRNILTRLTNAFPGCQFIVTSRSTYVSLSDTPLHHYHLEHGYARLLTPELLPQSNQAVNFEIPVEDDQEKGSGSTYQT